MRSIQITPPAWLNHDGLKRVMKTLEASGAEVRLVGGVVRDMIAANASEPMPSDIDMACSALPEVSMKLLTDAGFHVIPTGIDFGTITVVISEDLRLEITTLRRDTSCDGRHARVAYGSDFAEDAQRRDFTMNALYLLLDGTIDDYVGGLEDARHKRVRFIGDAHARIQEDALRILRFYRFHAQLQSAQIEGEGHAACRDHAQLLAPISGERIQQEMKKLLASPAPSRVLIAMQQAGLLAMLQLRDLPDMRDFDALSRCWRTRLSCLLTDAADVASLSQRWKLSRADSSWLTQVVSAPLIDAEAEDAAHARRAYWLGDHYVAVAQRSAFYHHAGEITQRANRIAKRARPQFPVRSAMLQQVGYQGKALGEALKTLEHAWVESDFSLEPEALIQRL